MCGAVVSSFRHLSGLNRTSQRCFLPPNVLLFSVVHLQVFSYSLRLFVQAGLTDELAQCANVGVGVVMVLMTLVSIPLMDRTGRRTLHLYGLGGMFIFSIFITISLLVSVSRSLVSPSDTQASPRSRLLNLQITLRRQKVYRSRQVDKGTYRIRKLMTVDLLNENLILSEGPWSETFPIDIKSI